MVKSIPAVLEDNSSKASNHRKTSHSKAFIHLLTLQGMAILLVKFTEQHTTTLLKTGSFIHDGHLSHGLQLPQNNTRPEDL